MKPELHLIADDLDLGAVNGDWTKALDWAVFLHWIRVWS